jgi:uncharacterized protein YceH (UPF0502 family)
MPIQLSPLEVRVIGCLLEKEIITPEQYPLSLAALTAACNQKSSREPVMQLSENQVQEVVDGLVKRYLVSDRAGFGSRVTKYQHRFCNSEIGAGLRLDPQELGIICVLLLRGAQTPGELRTRTQRLCEFADVQETEAALQRLIDRADGPLVARLAREPGKRESRYMHLFSAEPESMATSQGAPEPVSHDGGEGQERVDELESLLLELQERIEALKVRLDRLDGGS